MALIELSDSLATPTHRLLHSLLCDIAPETVVQWNRQTQAGEPNMAQLVTVNGAQVPIVRPPWHKIGDWFEELYRRSNDAFFSNRLPHAVIRWNRRFRNLGGRIEPRRNLIEMSLAHYEACGAAALGVVLIHEQIHYSLYVDGLDSGHTSEFKRRSFDVGLREIRHRMPLPLRLQKPRRVHCYVCGCGTRILTLRLFRKPRACAACCNRHAGGKYDSRFRLRYVGVEMAMPRTDPLAEAD